MKTQLISEITRQMIPYLDNAQMEQLQNVLQHALWSVQITVNEDGVQQPDRETNSKYYSSLSFQSCQQAASNYRQEWMTCRTLNF